MVKPAAGMSFAGNALGLMYVFVMIPLHSANDRHTHILVMRHIDYSTQPAAAISPRSKETKAHLCSSMSSTKNAQSSSVLRKNSTVLESSV
jgi:hypothetical protein